MHVVSGRTGRVALRRVIMLTALGLWVVPVAGLDGQTPRVPAGAKARPLFGFLIGGESVPAGLDRTCGDPAGRRGLALLGAFLVVPVGPVGLQGRVNGHLGGTTICAIVDDAPARTGTFIEHVPALPEGGFTTIDLSLRWPPGDGLWVLAAGGGWAGSSKDVPYVTASVGLRSATRPIRFGADLEVSTHRVPWTERTLQYSDGSVTEQSSRRYEAWAPTVGLRITVEIPIVQRRRPDSRRSRAARREWPDANRSPRFVNDTASTHHADERTERDGDQAHAYPDGILRCDPRVRGLTRRSERERPVCDASGRDPQAEDSGQCAQYSQPPVLRASHRAIRITRA